MASYGSRHPSMCIRDDDVQVFEEEEAKEDAHKAAAKINALNRRSYGSRHPSTCIRDDDVKHGADVNYHRQNTRSLLSSVVEKITEPDTDSRKFQLEACKLMLKAGAHIDDNTNVDMGYTPLHVAIDTRNDELLTLLLDEGNSVQITTAMEITDNRGRTPIKLAQERGYGKAVVILHHHLNKRHIQEDMTSAVMVQLGDVASEEYKQFEHNARRFRWAIPAD
jgi:ankyrin repeat protein